jgi:ribosomal protein S18 acetylase RimI-like enzyme
MITVHKFRLSELPQVLRIERASFKSEGYSAMTFLAYAFRDRKRFFVAKDEQQQVVGYVLVRLRIHWLGERKGGITSIAVAPVHRRQGIGRELLQFALTHLRMAPRCPGRDRIRRACRYLRLGHWIGNRHDPGAGPR